MPNEKCRVTTLAGRPCGWEAAKCPVPSHRTQRAARPGAAPPPSAESSTAATSPIASAEPPLHVGARDLTGLGWWLVERVILGAVSTAEAAVLASVMRVLAGLGPGEMDRDSALREAQLRGLVMHGIPPRNQEEWELAEAVFDEEALAEFHRWETLLETHADDRREPLLFRHRAGHEADPALGIDGEDGL